MDKFNMINSFYHTVKSDGTRLWNKKQVANAVVKGWITSTQYKEITGVEYISLFEIPEEI